MIAEVIAIGDELTSGQRLDTNSQWLSRRLGDLGIRVLFHSTVGDDLAADIAVFRTAVERADVVLATGGLGPTADDLTRQALAEAAHTDLVTDQQALDRIRQMFARRGREMPQRNVVQAQFPRGSRMIPNPHGTAPGVWQEFERRGARCSLFALPGVPAEMREMWQQTVQPELIKLLGHRRRFIHHHTVKCFGIGESDLEQMLPDLIRRGRTPSVGITVSQATITLRVSAEADSKAACEALIAPTVLTIEECLGNLVFGSGDDELPHAVVRLLKKSNSSVATAEWGSSGMLADWLSEADPNGSVFRGGYVFSAASDMTTIGGSAAKSLGQPADVVSALAQRVREHFQADYGLAIGPFPNDRVSDRFRFTLATPDDVLDESSRFAGHPDILKSRSTKMALNFLRLHLLP